MIVYSVCVIAFTFLYTALIFNPKQMAEDLKRNNGFIPGVKPGQDTADYIGTIMDRITLPGAVLLAFVGILPGIFELVFKTQQELFYFLWWYFIADHGRCNIRYIAADRNTITHAPVRWLNEQWQDTGQADCCKRNVTPPPPKGELGESKKLSKPWR